MSNEGEAPLQPAFEKADQMRRNELADIFKTPGIHEGETPAFAPVVLFDYEGVLVFTLYGFSVSKTELEPFSIHHEYVAFFLEILRQCLKIS